jgi:hypothetical protein
VSRHPEKVLEQFDALAPDERRAVVRGLLDEKRLEALGAFADDEGGVRDRALQALGDAHMAVMLYEKLRKADTYFAAEVADVQRRFAAFAHSPSLE